MEPKGGGRHDIKPITCVRERKGEKSSLEAGIGRVEEVGVDDLIDGMGEVPLGEVVG